MCVYLKVLAISSLLDKQIKRLKSCCAVHVSKRLFNFFTFFLILSLFFFLLLLQPINIYEIGRTKVYFSTGVLEFLESLRGAIVHTSAKILQRTYRGSRQRKLFWKMKRYVFVINMVHIFFIWHFFFTSDISCSN